MYRVYRVYSSRLRNDVLTSGDPMLWYGKMAGMAQLSLPVREIYYVGSRYGVLMLDARCSMLIANC